MIDLHYWPTPNGHKIAVYLEEAGIEYKISPVNIGKGDQFDPYFLSISPNNRIPAIVDHEPAMSDKPVSIFESGAILLYLAEKTGKFIPQEPLKRIQCLEWLFWQMGGLGPMLGQNHHFTQYAPEKIPYAMERYQKETQRLYGVLNKRLQGRDYIVDEYSIADMACYPWCLGHEKQEVLISEFPDVKAWIERINKRPAVVEAYAKGEKYRSEPTVNKESAKVLFGQDASIIK